MSNVSKAQDSLTILMPCLNEAVTIGRCIETVKESLATLAIRAVRQKLMIVEVPTHLFPDGCYKKPHLRSFRDGWRHLKMWLFLWRNGKKSL